MKVTAPDGCVLDVEVHGRGEPVLLISGFGGLGNFWAGAGSLLAESHQVVTFDHRGRGRSDRSRSGHSIEQLAQDVVTILNDLGLERVALVGHSTGGMVAQTLALDASARVSRLVLSGTWAKPDAHFRLLFETRIEIIEKAGPRAHARLSHLIGYPPEWINAHEVEVETAIAAASTHSEMDQAIDLARLRMLLDYERAAEIGSITIPTLVVAATDDGIIPVGHGRELAVTIPGASLVLTEGGHFFPRIDPARFVADISAFLDGRDA